MPTESLSQRSNKSGISRGKKKKEKFTKKFSETIKQNTVHILGLTLQASKPKYESGSCIPGGSKRRPRSKQWKKLEVAHSNRIFSTRKIYFHENKNALQVYVNLNKY